MTSVDNVGVSVVLVAVDKVDDGFTISLTASDFSFNMLGTEDRFHTDEDIL